MLQQTSLRPATCYQRRKHLGPTDAEGGGISDAQHNLPVADNLLSQDFAVAEPNEKCVSDITYVATDEG